MMYFWRPRWAILVLLLVLSAKPSLGSNSRMMTMHPMVHDLPPCVHVGAGASHQEGLHYSRALHEQQKVDNKVTHVIVFV